MGRSAWLAASAAFVAGMMVAAVAILMLRPVFSPVPAGLSPPALPFTAPAPAPPEPAPPEPDIRTASIAAIDANRGAAVAVFRPDIDPDIIVIDFPDMHDQALTLNRVAALIEKAGMPRDTILSEAELNARIAAEGGNVDRFYIGHDYRAADLARFFATAARQGMELNPHEAWLRDLLRSLDWLKPGAVGALITIPGATGDIDAAARSAILHHELSHAVYFTDPAYVRLTMHLWNDMLTAEERAAFRRFLASEGYDASDEDLMANEGQAYLIHTTDPRFFTPAVVGMTDARAAALRAAFIAAIPEAWLKQSVPNPPPAETAPPAPPKHRPPRHNDKARPGRRPGPVGALMPQTPN